jgi:hypothetical protein
LDLPSVDYSLLVTLPQLISPDLQRLRESIEHDDPDWGWDALTAVHKQIDTPQQRARLADAIVGLRDQHQINRRQAAYALIDLHSQSTRLIAASLLQAIAISVGAERPPYLQRNRDLTLLRDPHTVRLASNTADCGGQISSCLRAMRASGRRLGLSGKPDTRG